MALSLEHEVGATVTVPTSASIAERDRSGDIARSEQLAHNVVRRILVATAVAVPACALLFAGLVGVAAALAGVALVIPMAAGAACGALAGTFCGMWIGVVLSVDEIEDVEHQSRAEHAAFVLGQQS